MTGFQSPNHTQIPNDLFDEYLSELGHAELKILLAILRQTLGFHRRRKRMSLTTIQEATGLARSSVQAGCDKLDKSGLVTRIKTCRVTEWVVNWNDYPPDMGVLGVSENGIVPESSPVSTIPETDTDYTEKPTTTVPETDTPSVKESIKNKNIEIKERESIPKNHPSIKIYREIMGRWPENEAKPMIVTIVGDDENDWGIWKQHLIDWKLSGWNKSNIRGILESFANKVIKSYDGGDGVSEKQRIEFKDSWTFND